MAGSKIAFATLTFPPASSVIRESEIFSFIGRFLPRLFYFAEHTFVNCKIRFRTKAKARPQRNDVFLWKKV